MFIRIVSLSILLIPAATHAQIIRNASNPYSQTTGNGFSSTGNNAYNRNPTTGAGSNPLSLLNGNVFPNVSSNSPYGGGLKMNVSTRSASSGYTTGGSGSFSTCKPPVNPMPLGGPRYEAPRKAFDRWAVERDRPENPQAEPSNELARQLVNASPREISSGEAMNAILKALTPHAAKIKAQPPLAIDEAFMKRLSFNRGTGSVGLLRQEGKIEWPALLLNLTPKEEVAKVRQQIDTRFQDAFNQVAGGAAADDDNLKALRKSIDVLNETAAAQVQSKSFTENVQIKQHLKSLEDSVAFLKQPEAGDWLPGRPKFKAQSVQELAGLMQEKGIRFAPAFAGNEQAYTAMHRALATVYAGVANDVNEPRTK